MQSLNDDMDELFRRAGDEYPLNTNGADWNKVMQGLHATEEDMPQEHKKKKDFRYLWLLLLLPIGFICGRYVGNDNKGSIATESNKEVSSNIASSDKKEHGQSITSTRTTNLNAKETDTKEVNSKASSAGNKERINSTITYSKNNSSQRIAANANSDNSIKNKKGKLTAETPEAKEAVSKTAVAKNGRKNKESNLMVNKAADKNKGNRMEQDNKVTTNSTTIIKEETTRPALSSVPAVDTTSKSEVAKKNNNAPAKNSITTATAKSISKKGSAFKRTLYYSFVTGPDLSMVKNERVSRLGYSIGLMIGYQFSKKIAVEAGVLWDRKNYYAGGEYLDTSKLELPIHSHVSKMDGYCNMIEIPVNIKYDFVSRQNHKWFLSAGISSYLMKKEDYNLTYTRYNQQYVKEYGYKNSSKDWSAIVNVSAGYQKVVGKYTTIGIAPYVKLPLRGVGVGKLPITSTGIYISISRSVH